MPLIIIFPLAAPNETTITGVALRYKKVGDQFSVGSHARGTFPSLHLMMETSFAKGLSDRN